MKMTKKRKRKRPAQEVNRSVVYGSRDVFPHANLARNRI